MTETDDVDDFDLAGEEAEDLLPLRRHLPSDFDVFTDLDCRSALFKATSALYRLEAFCADGSASRMVATWSRRREAVSICAAADRKLVAETSVAGMGGESLADINSQADRLATDILEAMAASQDMQGDRIGEAEIRTLIEISDQSNLKLMSGDETWRMEQDFSELAADFSRLMDAPTPWGAAEAVRLAWTGERFGGINRRAALILAAPLIRAGFGVRHFVGGIAAEAIAEAERMDTISSSTDDFFVFACRAIDRGATAAREAGQRLKRLEAEFAAACGPQREGRSRTGAAIEAVLSYPVFTPQALRRSLGTTDRGTEFILDKLHSAGCIAEHETSTRRNRTFVCRKALNITV